MSNPDMEEYNDKVLKTFRTLEKSILSQEQFKDINRNRNFPIAQKELK